ncbi:glycosyltransferase [Spirosoma fluviale]|uniref:Glycosyltransferase involved in cell wall bisynthesis n=1 Tax=Spirosoma fluviale TaxID=1597977 RepID=A0A286G3S9_9BACT|nr:glycosyltransferase [Spirosoma fluviale]SOD90191.1 Glycosyltransferase involved in cell wall bisynthesis [Spirosoma fluviale]
MKIVMSADWFYPAQVGGSASTIYWQAKALTAQGHQVSIVATSQNIPNSIPLNRWLSMDCGRVIYTKNPHFYLPVRHILSGLKAIRKADVVHVNSLFYPASFIWVIACRLRGKPVVWSPHGELSPAALKFRPYLKRLLLLLFRGVSAGVLFHATSVDEMRQIQRRLGAHVQVTKLRTMMDPPLPVVRVARPYLLFMGRLHPIKGVEQLLKALAGSDVFLKSHYSLQIAGPDTDKTYTRKLKEQVMRLGLSEKVFFIGNVQGEGKEQIYANAHLLILPSHAENFGNVVIESLAQGTPVIASTNTPWQVLETKQTGRWVPNDAESLRKAIDIFLTMKPDHYAGYRARAAQLVRSDYMIDGHIALWSDVYKAAHSQNRLVY